MGSLDFESADVVACYVEILMECVVGDGDGDGEDEIKS